ncbi:hypothetical protein CHUAL_008006 [Chamberlinius hualienensis]
MAYVRDNDTSLWLHNKLGTGNDLWSGRSICSHLNRDVLRNVKDCFADLQTQVKLKLLLSFIHIPRRNVDEWSKEMYEIIEIAIADSDQWVSTLGELLKTFPSSGTVNMELEENARVFTDLLNELKKIGKKQNDLNLTPMESLYLNKNALATVIGQAPQPAKHFALKRKPKSAALRAELLQKSTDAANNLKSNSTPGIPVRSRSLAKRMDDTTPLKGFSSRTPTSGFRGTPTLHRLNSVPAISSRGLPNKTPIARKDGGIKLLDITEQPIGFGRDAKRRKKMPGQDEPGEQIKKEKDSQAGQSPVAAATPEYAAGLISSPTTPQLTTLSSPLTSLSSSSETVTTPTTPTPNTPAVTLGAPNSTITTVTTTVPAVTPSAASTTAQTTITPTRIQVSQPATTTIVLTKQTAVTSNGLQPNSNVSATQQSTIVQVITTAKPAGNNAQTVGAQPQMQKKGLSLTKEQMQEAQAMFLTANKVTRPEKALILGFMAGARDNPCPHLGNIVTIKLSEDQETVTQSDGTTVNMMAEMHFQMNYNTGEWKRVKKYKKIEI